MKQMLSEGLASVDMTATVAYIRLAKHRKAVADQYRDPVKYYGEMPPSDIAKIRVDLMKDVAAFDYALDILEDKINGDKT